MRLSQVLGALSIAIIFALLVVALPAAPAAGAQGTIILSDTTGQVGMVLSISGTGFTLGGSYTVNFGTTVVLTGTITAGGVLAGTIFAVPPKPRGTYSVTVTTTGGDTSNAIAFTVTPIITLSSSAGFVGDQFYLSGSGFSASSTVTIYFDTIAAGSVSTDSNGAFANSLVTVPESYRGTHTVRGYDIGGYSPSVTYTVNSKITVSPATAAAGTQLTIGGTGFSASSALSLYIDDVSVSANVTTNALGSFAGSTLTVPAIVGGNHMLKAQDATGGAATVTFVVSQTMALAPQTGPAGTAVKVTGTGFGASKIVTITYKNAAVTTSPAPVNTDANGNFSASFTVPAGPAGSYPLVATDGTFLKSTNFTTTASATVSPTRGAVGTSITGSGGGFRAGVGVTIKYDVLQVAVATTDANGAFSTSFPAPPSTVGDHTITASDGVNTVTFTFTIVSSASLNLISGHVGSDITISGAGFPASRAVIIKYDDNQVATSTTDASGGFSATFKAPVSKGGNHIITATDGVNTVTTTFAMDSTPPPVPTLLLPVNDTKADALAKFSWMAVTDPSGVTYTLQVSADANFYNIILQKKGLTNHEYRVTELEKLKSVSKKEPYYWRVKAVDGAANESDWTKRQTFFVGFIMPTWGLYTIFGFACLLIGLLGFWLGRRTSYRWDW